MTNKIEITITCKECKSKFKYAVCPEYLKKEYHRGYTHGYEDGLEDKDNPQETYAEGYAQAHTKFKNKKWEHIEIVLNSLETEKEKFEKILNEIKLAPESVIAEPFYTLFSSLVSALDKFISLDSESIDWFVSENLFGKKSLGAGAGENEMPIRTVTDLRKFAEED